jgi:hypothetical protein
MIGKAPNASEVPNELTAYARHSHPNSRPSTRLGLTCAIQAGRRPAGQTTGSPARHNEPL